MGKVGIPIKVYPRHMCVPVLSQDLDFQRHVSWSFFRFVDIGGLVDQDCITGHE